MLVHKVIEEVVPGDEGAHGDPLVDGLIPVGHRPAGHEMGHGGADLLGVDAQVVLFH